MNNIKQFVAWGYKLHTHTHSYIHYGFIKTFSYLGYKTLWLDNTDDISNIDFSNSLFITTGDVDANIPKRNDCYYILHNADSNNYSMIPPNNIQYIQVITVDSSQLPEATPIPNTRGYYYIEKLNTIYFPWGTDLLPHEIDVNINNIDNILESRQDKLYFIGTITPPWEKSRNICNNLGIEFVELGGYTGNNVSSDDNQKMIQESIVSLAVQDVWQLEHGYLPCRVFKNICYGRMVLTNNKYVQDYFDNKLVFDDDIQTLIEQGIEFEKNPNEYKKEKILELMKLVRDNHTYLNLIKSIFWGFKQHNVDFNKKI